MCSKGAEPGVSTQDRDRLCGHTQDMLPGHLAEAPTPGRQVFSRPVLYSGPCTSIPPHAARGSCGVQSHHLLKVKGVLLQTLQRQGTSRPWVFSPRSEHSSLQTKG